MKFALALAFLLGCQAAADIPAAVLESQVTCGETYIHFAGLAANFPRYAGADLIFGNGCNLGDDFSINADVNACGLKQVVTDDFVTFSGDLKSPAVNDIITRKSPIDIKITCQYNRKADQTAGASIQPNLGEIVGALGRDGGTLDLYLNLLNAAGDVVDTDKDTLEVEVGTQVTAMVGGTNLEALGLHAYATDCYATPSADSNGDLKYDLIASNCEEDNTVVITASGNGQTLSFESFAFTSDVNAQVYLHCNLVACAEDAGCGECASRKRRSLLAAKRPAMRKSVTVKL